MLETCYFSSSQHNEHLDWNPAGQSIIFAVQTATKRKGRKVVNEDNETLKQVRCCWCMNSSDLVISTFGSFVFLIVVKQSFPK